MRVGKPGSQWVSFPRPFGFIVFCLFSLNPPWLLPLFSCWNSQESERMWNPWVSDWQHPDSRCKCGEGGEYPVVTSRQVALTFRVRRLDFSESQWMESPESQMMRSLPGSTSRSPLWGATFFWTDSGHPTHTEGKLLFSRRLYWGLANLLSGAFRLTTSLSWQELLVLWWNTMT